METIYEYLDQLTINDYLKAYGEYKTGKRTGVYPTGVIRTVAKMCKPITGNFDLTFAERLVLERIADMWHRQNKV